MFPTRSTIFVELERLKKADPEFKVFGSNAHQYRLNPPLEETVVIKIEQRLGIRFPDEYRNFILKVGDGGAGPVYGIMSLKRIVSLLEDSRNRNVLFHNPSLPFVRPYNLEEDNKLEYPAHGMIPLAEIGCGGEYFLVTSGEERGNVWAYAEGFLPVNFEPRPRIKDIVEDKLENYAKQNELNEVFNAKLLSREFTQRVNFLEWYMDWLKDARGNTSV